MPGVLRIYPEWQWHAWFIEGTASNEWHDSRLYLQVSVPEAVASLYLAYVFIQLSTDLSDVWVQLEQPFPRLP